jgi:hypothetical protein
MTEGREDITIGTETRSAFMWKALKISLLLEIFNERIIRDSVAHKL